MVGHFRLEINRELVHLDNTYSPNPLNFSPKKSRFNFGSLAILIDNLAAEGGKYSGIAEYSTIDSQRSQPTCSIRQLFVVFCIPCLVLSASLICRLGDRLHLVT